jgi:hypothetical protein
MRGQWSIDPWATGNQIHLMPFKGLANFKAPKKMADPQDMLAVVDNLHGILHILSIMWTILGGYPCMCKIIYEINIFSQTHPSFLLPQIINMMLIEGY